MQREWNRYFREHDMDAFLDRYPADKTNLHERLSEMFHFDRRIYVVAPRLQHLVTPLLDHLDTSVENGKVTLILNCNGVLTGYGLPLDPIQPEPFLRLVDMVTEEN